MIHRVTNSLIFPSGCDESCEGNCTSEGPKGCIECAEGYVKTDEEGCKGELVKCCQQIIHKNGVHEED